MVLGAFFSGVFSDEPGYRDTLLKYIEKNRPERVADPYRTPSLVIVDQPAAEGAGLFFEKGDWERYVTSNRYRGLFEEKGIVLYTSEKMNITSYGSLKANLAYGDSVFTDEKYRRSDTDRATSKVISKGFTPTQELQLHLEGTMGRRMKVYIDHDSRREDNRYRMQYRAIRDDEIIREINAGEVDISMKESKYAVYDNASARGLGVDVTLKKGDFQVKAFGSVTRGETVVENFKGTASPGSMKLADYQYIRRMYYQLEPFRRYDGLTSPPAYGDPSVYTTLNTFTSGSTDFSPSSVNIDSSGFALYLDDQVGSNNTGEVQLALDGGYYTKLSEGTDYTINYATGVIKFLKNISESSRVYAVYKLKNGSTSDPAARTDIYPGYYFVFIRYGYSIDEDIAPKNFTLDAGEDKNGDGRLNSDIYEIRSYFNLGSRNIISSRFSMQFLHENSLLSSSEKALAGSYEINYEKGLVFFVYREPFRKLLGDSAADIIYSEKQLSSAYTASEYSIRADFYREARSFKLKHFNIIPGSVRVRINGREIQKNLYTVDNTSGYLAFSDPNNPLITSESAVEIRYEYLPLGGQANSFVGGVRADYQINRSLGVGGTLLYTRSGGTESIPVLTQAPTDTLLLEGDATFHLTPRRMAGLVNRVAGTSYRSVPVDLKLYGEYARSMKNINSFGKGLVDNMEATEEIVAISLSEKDWILSSLTESVTGSADQSQRGKLLYYYYRDVNNPGVLKTTSYTPTALDYSVKPGPFNVATGHVDASIEKEKSQQSLVFDFDFSDGPLVSVATRHLSSGSVDFSGLQYVEVSWRYEGESSSDSVNLFFDVGTINEDSDGDGSLDTEDVNGNGELDTDPDSGSSEDRGYTFNGNNLTVEGAGPGLSSGTRGDGYLSTEDLNGNGVLDISENYLTLPGARTSPSSVTLSAADREWHETRIYLDASSLSDGDIDLLKQVQAIRLSLQQNGSTARGRIYIDRIRFVSSRWKDPRFHVTESDEGITTTPEQLTTTVINSLNDSTYRLNAFHLVRENVYTSLYGARTSDELNKESESALKLEYNTNGGSAVSIKRIFAETMDLRFYRTLHLWLNCRNFVSGDVLGIAIGSSEDDYREFRYALNGTDSWQEVTMKLQEDSAGDLAAHAEEGSVDFKRIKFMKLTLYGAGTAGELWVNDIYVSEAETLSSSASWIEGEVNVKRPLFCTRGGVPILSDIKLKYIRKGHGANFSSIGKSIADMREQFDQLFTSFKITPSWQTTFDFVREVSSTDSLNTDVAEDKRGDTRRMTFNVESAYTSKINAVPSVKLGYRGELYDNGSGETISGGDVERNTSSYNHAPVLLLEEKIEKFLWGKLTARLMMNLLFSQEKIDRSSNDFSTAALAGITAIKEEEKRQKSDSSFVMEYRNSLFYLRPSVTASSEEMVAYAGKGENNEAMIYSDFYGNFHFPFVYNDDMRFLQRNKTFKCDLGFHGVPFVTPLYGMEMSYYENAFRDYRQSDLLLTDRFSREKDARSYVATKINLPVNLKSLGRWPLLRFVKSLNASYSRSLYLTENAVPFEGEGKGEYSEEYGISRTMGELAGAGLNIFQHFPGFFFLGRDSSAKGRDYVYSTLNESLAYEGGETVSDYTSSLKLIESMGLNWLFDFKKFTFNTGLKLSQISERQTIEGLPRQIISRDLSFQFRFDLMKFFRFGFFRVNRAGTPHHAASCDIGYVYSSSMIITSNITEDKHTPGFGLNFKWGRSHVGCSFGVDISHRRETEFLTEDMTSDSIYFNNISITEGLSEFSTGYSLALVYETNLVWLFNLLSHLHRLAAYPVATLEYKMALNRYDYSVTTAPEAYDMHLFTGKLAMDVHKNVQGGIVTRFALEQYRNRETGSVNREIFSYEISGRFTLIF